MLIKTNTPLLQIFEDLGSLSKNFGLYKVKPFRDWKGSEWQHKILTMRLCNVGEMIDIASYCNDIPEAARTHVTRVEILIRSIWAIDDRVLLTPEELKEFNEANNTELTTIEYLRNWCRNLEEILLERLDAVYGGLQLKQLRMLQGNHMCERCGTVVSEVSTGSLKLKYTLSEILCPTCTPTADPKDYDIAQEAPVTQSFQDFRPDVEVPLMVPSYICDCKLTFETFEEYTSHRTTCTQAGAV